MAGIEPATYRLTAECSDQLSYITKQRNYGVSPSLPNRIRTSDLRNFNNYNPPLLVIYINL